VIVAHWRLPSPYTIILALTVQTFSDTVALINRFHIDRLIPHSA